MYSYFHFPYLPGAISRAEASKVTWNNVVFRMQLWTLLLQAITYLEKHIKQLKFFIAPNFPWLQCFLSLPESICKEKYHRIA